MSDMIIMDIFNEEQEKPPIATAKRSAWPGKFRSRSRADFVKVSSLLARSLDMDIAERKGLLIGVGGPINSGKALILDTIAHDLSAEHNCYQMPALDRMHLEQAPDEAYEYAVHGQILTKSGKILQTTFRNFCELDTPALQQMKTPGTIALFSYNYPFSAQWPLKFGADLVIALDPNGPQWHNNWTVAVAENRRTPKMQGSIEHLNDVYAIRLERLGEPEYPPLMYS